ncbi:MAG: DUF2892 domain-containing protein [Cardiobacteriaceae bacterium]|nr:DUF2892 domain-containing protein [Cardiobacteriaceae bacterium]
MKTNIGTIDRGLRIGVGALLIVLALMGKIGWWGWLGLIPLATGFVRFCPLYPLLGINTCSVKRDGDVE